MQWESFKGGAPSIAKLIMYSRMYVCRHAAKQKYIYIYIYVSTYYNPKNYKVRVLNAISIAIYFRVDI